MSLEEVIKDNFNQILMTEGVEVMNTTENKSFYGLVSSGELNAVFTVIDQDLSDSLQITTLKENRPKTGQKIQVGDKIFTVKQIQDRINSPLIRIFVEK